MSRQRIIGFCGSSWRPARSRALVEAVGADSRRVEEPPDAVDRARRRSSSFAGGRASAPATVRFFEACAVSTAIYASAAELEAGQPLPTIIAARLANAVDQFAGHLKARCADAA